MGKIKMDISDDLFNELPLNREELEEVLKLGLKQFNARRKKEMKSIIDDTFGAIPIRNHDLIEQVCEQAKYGE